MNDNVKSIIDNEKQSKYFSLYFMYIVCIFWAVFDGVRGVQFPSYFPFSLLRDASVFLLFFIAVGTVRQIKYNRVFLFLVFLQVVILIYTLVTSILIANNTVYVRSNSVIQYRQYGAGVGVWMKMLTFICLTYATYCMAKCFKQTFVYNTMKWFVFASFIYSFLTIVLFLAFPNIAAVLSHWGGRLSIGYPTEDVCFLSLSLIFLYYLKFPLSIKIIFFGFNAVCLIFQNTLTGFLLLGYITFFYFVKGKFRLRMIVLVSVFLIIFTAEYIYNNSEQFSNFGILLHAKINSLLNFNSSNDDPSFYLRMQQKELMLKTISSDSMYLLFGYGGIGGMAVESGVYSIFGFSGILGLVIYSVTILYLFSKSIFGRNIFLFSLLIIYCISSVSIAPLYLMTTYWLFSFIIVYCSFSFQEQSIKITYEMANK